MASLLPQNFPTPTETAIATYDYSDVASGLGYREFQCFATTVATSSEEYFISDNPIYSVPSSTGQTVNNHTVTQTTTFKTSAFRLAQTIEGMMFLQITHSINATSFSGTARITATLQHYDGDTTTVTDLGNAVSDDHVVAPTGTTIPATVYMPISISKIIFKKGDKLYLKIEHYQSAGGVGNRVFALYHDPTDAAIGANTNPTTLKLQIPFRLDL